jgi:phage baseplate assembly protein W
MSFIFEPSIPLGTTRVWLGDEHALAARVRMVLETRPGRLPWRPTFGCDLGGLVGFPVTPELVERVAQLIKAAIGDWIPDAEVVSVDVRAVPLSGGHALSAERTVPAAEAALLLLGVQASLEAVIELVGPSGPVSLTTSVSP